MPIEIKVTNSKRCYIQGEWEARAETPAQLALRFVRMIDALERIDPVLSRWRCGKNRATKFERVRDRYAEEVAAGVSRDDWEEPVVIDGYRFGAITRDTPKNRSFWVHCKAGSIVKRPFANHITFENSFVVDPAPDPDVVTYRIFRPALAAIADAWEPVTAGAYSLQLIELNEEASWFPKSWIQYLCPWLARKITPPSTALVEYLPNGGLLMTATTETFDVNNPKHLAVASDMAAAMAPLNRLPWPSEP